MKNNDNAKLGALFDTTLPTQNSVQVFAGQTPLVGDLITYDGKAVTAAADAVFGVVGDIGATLVNGKLQHSSEYVPCFSAGRVGVNAVGAVAGAKAYYKIASKTYEAAGDIEAGHFITTGSGIQVLQVQIKGGV